MPGKNKQVKKKKAPDAVKPAAQRTAATKGAGKGPKRVREKTNAPDTITHKFPMFYPTGLTPEQLDSLREIENNITELRKAGLEEYWDDATYANYLREATGKQQAGKRTRVQTTLNTWEYRPTNSITLRTNVDGWNVDIRGYYKYDHWHFDLIQEDYPSGLEIKFLLNGKEFQTQPSFRITWNNPKLAYKASDKGQDVSFPTAGSAVWRTSIGGIRVDDAPLARERFAGSRDGSRGYDVIVIGSGLTGGIVADILSNHEIDVLVLEVGTLQFPTHASNLFSDTGVPKGQYAGNQGEHYGLHPMTNAEGPHYMVGGRSVFWSGVIPRMLDFETNLPEWPREVIADLYGRGPSRIHYYEQAEAMLNRIPTLGPFAQLAVKCMNRLPIPNTNARTNTQELGWALQAPEKKVGGNTTVYPMGIFSSADLLCESSFDSTPKSSFLTLNTGMMALELLSDAGTIEGVRCFDMRERVERIFRAKHYILAMGSVESPKLVWNSLSASERGLVGVGFTDHPDIRVKVNPNDNHDAPNVLLEEGHPLADSGWNHAKLYITHENPTLTQFPIHAEVSINTMFWWARYVDPTRRPSNGDLPIHASIKMHSWCRLNNSNKIEGTGFGQRAKMTYNGYTWPNGYVPLFDAWNLKNGILKYFNRGYDTNIHAVALGGGSIAHAVGSLRMGGSWNDSVVNSDSRFHIFDNLHCADASVMPVAIAANPSLTAVALAIRLAHKIIPQVKPGTNPSPIPEHRQQSHEEKIRKYLPLVEGLLR